ncbi:MAG: YdeI/OmpD-associated family protein [Anaerolineae bacterium]|nr:YdeI/OmpD-associated family protein [Anaerolineae bacterium]
MEITETFYAPNRAAWRAWLEANHSDAREIWLVLLRKGSDEPSVVYVEAVEEALCFGWIDGITKALDDQRRVQRFTPRRPNGNWTELNKERARRLIAAGLMTAAGHAILPDLSPDSFVIAPDILAALQADPVTWANFQAFPPLYQRVRISTIEEQRQRDPQEFQRRLVRFLAKTRQNEQFGGPMV